jgi:hypothetical protein
MTVEQEERLHKLPALIAQEKDGKKMVLLADELRALTTIKLAELKQARSGGNT